MNLSPPLDRCVFEASFAIVERQSPVQSLVDLHFGAREAEATGLLGDLEAAAFPLHDVVVADGAFMDEAADAVEAFWSRPPGGFHFAGSFGEPAIVVDEELAQDGVGGVEVGSLSQPQFAGKAILQHAPEALDAAFGLRAVGGDEVDAELFQGAAELGGLAFSSELFVDGPVVVVTEEDAAVIAVKSQWHAVAAQHLFEQAEIAESGLGEEELGGQDFAGGVVLHAESGELRAATFEPVVRAAIELHEFAEASGTHTALAMSGISDVTRRTETVATQQAAQRFATERKAFALD